MKYLADEFYLFCRETNNAIIAAICRKYSPQKQKADRHPKEKEGMKIDQSTASGGS